MSRSFNNSPASDPGGSPGVRAEDGRILREVGNLLDVSLRNVGVALRRVGEEADGLAGDEAVVRQLRDADWSLRRMAGLLRRWQHMGGAGDEAWPVPTSSLRLVVDEAVRCVAPLADRRAVALDAEVDAGAAEASAGTLQPVLISGLEQIIRRAAAGQTVELSARASDEELEIAIRLRRTLGEDRRSDVVAPPGHEARPQDAPEDVPLSEAGGEVLGMAVCRDIVRAMNGVLRLEVEGEADAATTELLVRVPMMPGGQGERG